MGKVLEILSFLTNPEQDWQHFLRKVVAILLATAIGGAGFWTYHHFSYAGERSVEELVAAHPELEDKIRAELKKLLDLHKDIQSVWLYGWPDAQTLVVVHGAGQGRDPMPLGFFRAGDEHAIGSFVLGKCTPLDRKFTNYSCPIKGSEDAWGVLVVVLNESDLCPQKRAAIRAMARKLSHLMYSNHQYQH